MTGHDNIDDAAAVIASLRAEVAATRESYAAAKRLIENERDGKDALCAEIAAQRALLKRVVRANDETPDGGVAWDMAHAITDIRSHLAGAAVPAAEGHVLPQAIRIAGAKMANTCFNWAQERRFTEHERSMLKRMQEDWDEALLALEAKP